MADLTVTAVTAAGPPARVVSAALPGALAQVCVGGSVAVSSLLVTGPMLLAEGVRYAAAALLLVGFARVAGHRLVMPRGREWLWLGGVTGTGLVLFNIALVDGSRHAEPAVIGVAVACLPIVLAVAGPLQQRSRPRPAVLAGAVLVTSGAALVAGLGHTDAAGLAWAVVTCGCETGFTLLAVPLLARHGPTGVSVHTTWLAAVVFCGAGLVSEGPAALAHLSSQQWLATAYLAVMVTAVAFCLWYSSVTQLGASRAGLLTGIAPAAAALTGMLLGGPAPQPAVWAGMAVVALGLAVGLRGPRSAPARPLSGCGGAVRPS